MTVQSGNASRTARAIEGLRRASIRTRLIVLGVVPMLAAILVGGLAADGFSQQTAAATSVAVDTRLATLALQIKYQAADWNGWQTAYAFDVLRGVGNAAADTGDSRAAFLASGSVLAAEMDTLGRADGLTAAEKSRVAAARTAIDAFNRADVTVVSDYRSRSVADREAANALVIGAEIDNYNAAAAAVDELSTSLTARAATATTQALNRASAGRRSILAALVLALLIVLSTVVLVVASINRPLRRLEERLQDVTDGAGDLTLRLDASGRDEVAAIASLFNRFVDQLAGIIRRTAEQAAAIASAAEEMSATADSIAASAEESSVQAQVVSAAAEQVSRNAQTASSGAEEMGASIREIAQNAHQAAAVASHALNLTSMADGTVARLGESSAEIGQVVLLITTIAEQTSLLALNATIEAARAGAAGRGFAVVANEIKELANETASATTTITRQVLSIQDGSEAAADAIAQISGVIGKINQFQSTIAAAVEEQTATTSDIARNIAESATGSQEIAANITGVANASHVTSAGVSQTQQAVGELAAMAAGLQELIGRFTY